MRKKQPKKPQVRHPGIAQTLLRKAGPIQSSKQKRKQNKERKLIEEEQYGNA